MKLKNLNVMEKNINSHNVIQFTTVPKISSLFIEFLGCCTNKSEVGINVLAPENVLVKRSMEMGNQIIEKLTCAISPLTFATLPVAYLGGHWAMSSLLTLPFSKQEQN